MIPDTDDTLPIEFWTRKSLLVTGYLIFTSEISLFFLGWAMGMKFWYREFFSWEFLRWYEMILDTDDTLSIEFWTRKSLLVTGYLVFTSEVSLFFLGWAIGMKFWYREFFSWEFLRWSATKSNTDNTLPKECWTKKSLLVNGYLAFTLEVSLFFPRLSNGDEVFVS